MSDPAPRPPRVHPPARPAPDALEERLCVDLLSRTYRHSLAVRDQCAALAPAFAAEPERAALAGLLHDCAKNLTAEACLRQAEAAGLAILEAERASPKVLHQRLGAHLARARYGVDDPAVLAAIACHTTGHAEMDALARCLFVADYTSADRDYPGVEALRAALARGADAAFRAVLAFKRDWVVAKGLPEHPFAEAAYRRWL